MTGPSTPARATHTNSPEDPVMADHHDEPNIHLTLRRA